MSFLIGLYGSLLSLLKYLDQQSFCILKAVLKQNKMIPDNLVALK